MQLTPTVRTVLFCVHFQVLQQVSPRIEDQVCTSALKNPDKNRPNHCYPSTYVMARVMLYKHLFVLMVLVEKGRVILRKEKSDYINASFLKVIFCLDVSLF